MRVIFRYNSNFLCSKPKNKTFWGSICVRKVLPKFFPCALNLCFWNPWLSFLSEQKKTHKILNKAQNVKFTFIIFFSRYCTGHLKCALDNPKKTFSEENRCFRSMTEHFHTNNFASRIISENVHLHI